MAEVYDTPQMIARDLTVEAVRKIPAQNNAMSPEHIGKTIGEIYTKILENVSKPGGEKKSAAQAKNY
ncbi:hypothetical protein ACFLWS_06230 [Chloroflexota bacterium]